MSYYFKFEIPKQLWFGANLAKRWDKVGVVDGK